MHDQVAVPDAGQLTRPAAPAEPGSAADPAAPPAGRWAPGCAAIGPVIDQHWFEPRGAGACLVRLEVPLSPEMMTAALFAAGQYGADEMSGDGELWGFIAQVLARDGTEFLADVAKNLPVIERNGSLPATASGTPGADWLAFCRHRIAQLTGQTS
jgi:hypothetical protein